MTSPPRVSAITVFLNAAPFIEEAIASVFAQTSPNWELLLVDDGSTDASTTIARRYAEAHPGRVRYLEHPGHQNRGASASRNLGIRHAQGVYVSFLDADDVWVPRKLEEQTALLDSRPGTAVVYGRTVYWYGWTGDPGAADRDYIQEHGIPGNVDVSPPALLTRFLRGEAAVPSMNSLMTRREAFERSGLFDESVRGLWDDQVIYSKLFLRERAYVASACWDWYRQHPDSSCAVAKTTGRASAGRADYLRWLESYLRSQAIDDDALWRALRRAQLQQRHPWLARLVRMVRRRVPALTRHSAPPRPRAAASGPSGTVGSTQR